MPTSSNGPASRLLRFTKTLDEVSRQNFGSLSSSLTNGQDNGLARLAVVFNVPISNESEIIGRLADIVKLPDEIELEIGTLPSTQATLVGFLPDVRAYLRLVSSSLGQVMPAAQPQVLAALEYISIQLQQGVSQHQTDGATLLRLKEELEVILVEIRDSDLDPEMSRFLSTHIIEIVESIDRFEFLGERTIINSIYRLYGDMGEYNAHHPSQQGSDELASIGSRFMTVISSIAIAVGLMANTAELVVIANSLGHGH